MVISEWQWEPLTGRYTHWQLLSTSSVNADYRHSVRVYSYTELQEMLRRVGLTVEAVYGGFTKEALVARRAADDLYRAQRVPVDSVIRLGDARRLMRTSRHLFLPIKGVHRATRYQ